MPLLVDRDPGLCRMTNTPGSYDLIDFSRIAGAECFTLLTLVFHMSKLNLPFTKSHNGFLVETSPNSSLTLDLSKQSDVDFLRNSISPDVFEKWSSCYEAAILCCTDVMRVMNEDISMGGTKCGAIWDGWTCHAATGINQSSRVKCPLHIEENNCNSILGDIYFECDSNGTWYVNDYGREWANYTKCFERFAPVKYRIMLLNIVCQTIGIVLLSAGLIVFFSYQKLQVDRINLHKNFFFSLLLHSVFQTIWESLFIRQILLNPTDHKTNEQNIPCVIIEIFLHYSRSSNFFWMFCESFYLHQLLVTVFNDRASLKIFYIIGWGIPFLLTVLFIIWNVMAQTKGCWNNNTNSLYLFATPNILILMINIIFLINIVRLIYKRLQYSNEHQQYRRTVRAGLILVPLFGTHFFLSPLVMCESSKGAEFVNTFNQLIESSQGSIVAIIFCFMNKEVMSLLKSTFYDLKEKLGRNSKKSHLYQPSQQETISMYPIGTTSR